MTKRRSQDRDYNRKTKGTDHLKITDYGAEPNHELKIKKIIAKNESQTHYMKKINGTAITFGVGPAGTGKTWLATVMAAQALKNGLTEKLVITRPSVEVGESLGFLPGELEEKYEPYFRPVRDALVEALGAGQVEYYIKAGKIEARPLQFLRGSTMKDCWVLADEMQNSTVGEMKMLLTRFGQSAKYVINGDIRQCDLAPGVKSGLQDALVKLRGLDDVAICNFGRADIVRHGIVRTIIDRYEGTEGYHDSQEGLMTFLAQHNI
jgi:phosphate starvation-inducible PhoH-like protein